MVYQAIKLSDGVAAIVGYVYASQMNTGKPSMQAVQSLVVSIVARLSVKAGFLDMLSSKEKGGASEDQKNQLVVAILSAMGSLGRGQNVLKGTIASVSVDLIAEDIVNKLLRVDDYGAISFGADG